MNDGEIYNPPQASLGGGESNKPGILAIVFAVLLSAPIVLIQVLNQFKIGGIPGAIGAAIGSLIPALFIVLVFQIGRRFRNPRSRWKIFAWSQLVFLLGQVFTVLQTVGANAGT